MPIELQLIRASEFVRLNAHGVLNMEASKEALALLARACWKRGLKCALLDVRAVPIAEKPRFTPEQISTLVDAFTQSGFTRAQRLAILFQADTHGRARMFAFLSRGRGLQVQTFADFEAALLWLSEESAETAKPKPARHAQTIPIKFAGTKGGAKPGAPRPAQRGHK